VQHEVQAEAVPLSDTNIESVIEWLTRAASECKREAQQYQERGKHIDACWFYGKRDAYRMVIQALRKGQPCHEEPNS
jgi:hypothetical protein